MRATSEILLSTVRSMDGGIGDSAAGLNNGAGRQASRLQAALRHNMENGFPGGDKVRFTGNQPLRARNANGKRERDLRPRL